MNFFCDSGGNIFHVDSEKVYQGSVNANKIYFIGAFPSFCEVTARFQLPNGTFTEPQLLTKVNLETLTEIQGKNGENFNVWYCLLNQIITQYYGIVSMQFNVIGTKNIVLATANSSFEILRGVPTIIDATNIEIETFTSQVLSYIASIDSIVKNYDETITESEEKFEQAITSLNVAKEKVDEVTKQLEEGLTDYVKKDDYATVTTAGVVMANYANGVGVTDGHLFIYGAENGNIEARKTARPITPTNLDYAVKVGVSTNTINLSDDEKTSACEWLGAVRDIDIGDVILTKDKNKDTGFLFFGINCYSGAIPQRDGQGKLRTNTPDDTDDETTVTNKKYVADAVANAGGKLYLHNIIFAFKDSTNSYEIRHKCYSTKSTTLTANEWATAIDVLGSASAMEPCVLGITDLTTAVGTYEMVMILRINPSNDTFEENSLVDVGFWKNGADYPDFHGSLTITGFTDTVKEI